MARPTVVVELAADAKYARELASGGVYVDGCQLALDSLCDLVVRGASDEAVFDARVVLREPTGGAALELLGFCPAMKQQLEFLIAATPTTQRFERADRDLLGGEYDDLVRDVAAFDATFDEARRAQATEVDPPRVVNGRVATIELDGEPAHDAPRDHAGLVYAAELAPWTHDAPAQGLAPWSDGGDDDLAIPVETADDALSIDDLDDAPAVIHGAPALEESAEITLDEPLAEPALEGLDPLDVAVPVAAAANDDADPDDDAGSAARGGDPDDPAHPRAALTVHERLRRLTLAEQLKKAHTGELQERVVLERMYGKTVWEPLLRNPRITAPEVARIARMGQLPKPLIEIIVSNGGWLQVPEVRRALLSNPRLAADQIMRVLRLMPKHEVKLAAAQTAYPHAVRDAAKRMAKESS